MEELPVTGVKTGGVKGINLKEDDHLVAVNVIEKDLNKITLSLLIVVLSNE